MFDAFALADTLRHEHAHWRPLPVASPVLAEVRALARNRDRLLDSQQRGEAQLRSTLEAYPRRRRACSPRSTATSRWPSSPTSPTPQAAARVGEQRMAGFCRRQSYRVRTDQAVLTQRLKDNLLSAAEGTVVGKSHSLHYLLIWPRRL